MRESKFQFINPHLEEIYFAENPGFDVNETEPGMNNSFQIQVKRSKEFNRAKVELTLESHADNEKTPFTLRVRVAADFRWDDLEEKHIDAMLKVNAPSLLLGYMRPIVASVTNVSKFPVYNLPFMDFTK